MKIQHVDMFHTPNGWDEIEAWITRHNAEERAHLWTAAVMAWNLAAELTNQTEKEDTDNA